MSSELSLDSKVFQDSSTTLLDTLQSTEHDQEEELASSEVQERLSHSVRVAVSTLDPRERFIVESRLMASRDDELSLAEIGRQLGVSRERARQLEERAKRKLKARISEHLAKEGNDQSDLVTAA